ncbi:hypothetical protein [Bythopirellula polymerisocia]|uniref:Uncharacterized protein n=1 Tax=Bythopirellula polymerisocia TaxID=2528003 RepID=A0A5C6CYM4_9BACT|nr:hypothetical protein [Bythopirellula polymerisocia]TWU28637.1 hypothetical protein Pla144_19290 [Bythopirellula polymerisocia]
MNHIRKANCVIVKKQSFIAAMMVLGLWATPSQAYEVWMGTHRMSSQLATEPTTWARTAAWVDGFNYNRSPHGTEQATGAQRKDVIRRINHVENTLVGVPRSQVTRTQVDEASRAAIADSIENSLQVSSQDGAQLNEFMLYDERGPDDVLYTWTETEIQIFREELDAQGQHDTRILWRAANNAARNLDFASLPLIDGLLIEASADRFMNNHFNVNTLANSFWNSSVNSDKELYLQIPRSENNLTQYEATRRAVLEMTNVLGVDGVRSDRLVVLPVTYGDNIDQLPETINNGSAYPDTMPGIQLSLIEQRPYFEGRMGELPANFAASTERFELPEAIASAADGSLRRDKNTNVVDGANLGFVVNNASLEVGQTGTAPYDRAAVIPFQLPNFGEVDDPFLSAHFEGFLTQTATQNGVTAALYGLDRRPTAEILDSDYYGLTGAPDPNATLLQEGFLRPDMDLNAPFYSNSGGNKNLLSFLNDQYAGGEGAGEYVFLRANTNEDSNQRWVFASGNDADESLRPQLRYLTVPEPPVVPTYGTLIAGWDTWDSATNPSASVLAPGVTGSAVTTTEQQAWNIVDGRGASNDGTWGTFLGPPTASTEGGDGVQNENLELPNATTGGTITFTITNNGTSDLDLDGFHFDAYAFRPKAARAYELSVSSGAITNGVIYTSTDDEITSVAGAWDNSAHDDISHSLLGLADHTLEVGGSVDFLLAFSSGDGDGSGGHDLWIDNVAITAVVDVIPGDFDHDGDVDGADFLAWQRNDGTPTGLAAWQSNYGTPTPLAASSAAIPEPSTILQLLLATILLTKRSYRKFGTRLALLGITSV